MNKKLSFIIRLIFFTFVPILFLAVTINKPKINIIAMQIVWVNILLTGIFILKTEEVEIKMEEDKCEKCRWKWEMSKEHCKKCKNNPDNKPVEKEGEEDNFEAQGE